MKKQLLILVLLISMISPIIAHDENTPKDEYYTGIHDILPFEYFQKGDIKTGIFVTIFWASIIYGVVVLYAMVLAPLFIRKK